MYLYEPSGKRGPRFFSLSMVFFLVAFFLGLGWLAIHFLIKKFLIFLNQYLGWDWAGWFLGWILLTLAPLFIGWFLNNFSISTIRRGHCRSLGAAKLVSLLAFLVFYLTFQIAHILQGLPLQWLSGANYILLPFIYGQNPWFFGGKILEMVMVLSILAHWARDHVSWPYCEECLTWFEFREFLWYSPENLPALGENFEALEWRNNPPSLPKRPEGEEELLEVRIAFCPKCKGQRGTYLQLCEKAGEEEEDYLEVGEGAMMKSEEYDSLQSSLPSGNLQFFSTHYTEKKPFPYQKG